MGFNRLTFPCLPAASVSFGVALALVAGPLTAQDAGAVIEEAVSAAPASISSAATVVDWSGNVLREGTNGWTCMPSPPTIENAPMCLDAAWSQWAQAWEARTEPPSGQLGIAYMLQGDAGASNIDPFATGPTADNEWVVTGPHLMLIVPDRGVLEGMTADPESGGPFVMWKGTPYAHIMVPIAEQ